MQSLITLDEVAEYLRVETAVVERVAQEGQLLAYRIGDQYRTTWDAVQAYLRANATAPDPGPGGVSRTANPLAYRIASSPPGGKYWRIGELLAGEREPRVTYSFARLELEMGSELPRSARDHRAWWSNTMTSHPHAQSWLSRGWRVVAVDLAGEEVTFEQRLTGRTMGKTTEQTIWDDLKTPEGREAAARLASRKALWLNEHTDKSGDVDDLRKLSANLMSDEEPNEELVERHMGYLTHQREYDAQLTRKPQARPLTYADIEKPVRGKK